MLLYKNSTASSERTGVTSRCIAGGRGFRPTFSLRDMRKERVSRRENGKDISSIYTELDLSPGGMAIRHSIIPKIIKISVKPLF